MINTNELMLGNIVEYEDEYYVVKNIGRDYININGVGSITSNVINPIPLTDALLKRLDLICNTTDCNKLDLNAIHELQNYRTIKRGKPLDITPLLAPRYTTHDGVEVWEGDVVWIIRNNELYAVMCNSTLDLFFSSSQACQEYIDSVTHKPVFTTEDGVDMFEGDEYWYCDKLGRGYVYTANVTESLINEGKDNIRFSTHELAQAYLNKVCAEAEYNKLMKK